MATKKTEDAKKVVAKKATVESVVAKAEAVKKAEAAKEVKAAVKAEVKEEKKPAAKTEPAKTEVKAEAKKPAAKKPAAKKPAVAKTTETVFVEYNNGQINVSDIVAKAKEALGNKAVKELNVYYQPETGMVYYTADGESGSYSL
jgi:D-aminopeptidase|uniref:DUF6465 family protein n=1 Tax=Coprococcus sp. TaxID=2049024 RepID=UPI004026B46B